MKPVPFMLAAVMLAAACREDPKPPVDTGEAVVDVDEDGDGVALPDDCDDGDASIYPGAEESCDGVDNNCDGTVDEGVTTTWYADTDGDGYGDDAATVQACTMPSGTTSDAGDCDDGDALVNPAQPEVCNGVDDNCDGNTDEDGAVDAATWYADADGDGYGDPAITATACSAPEGFVAETLPDCDDTNAAISPGADELCDGVDNNCDGTTDEDDALDASTWYLDRDGDGHGDGTSSYVACEAPAGTVSADLADDCDDNDASVHPDASETCNDVDDDCDGDVDEELLLTVYADVDGDGYGDESRPSQACTATAGFSEQADDCDDGDGEVHPDAEEVCDAVDNDCDGLVDDDDPDISDVMPWYADGDGDGWGDAGDSIDACEAPSGYVADEGDCDDGDASAYPGATEVAGDGVDNDCNGWVDVDVDLPTVPEGWVAEVYVGEIEDPVALAFDSAGYLYVAHDEVNGQIYQVPPGGGAPSFFGPSVQDPDSVATGADDTVYIGSESGVYQVLTDGTSGLLTSSYMGNNTSIEVDFDGVLGDVGALYVANARATTDIAKVGTDGSASSFTSGSLLYVMFGMAIDDTDLVVVECDSTPGLYRIATDGSLTAFVTSGFSSPRGLVWDADEGLFYVGDIGTSQILTVAPDGTLEVFADGVSPRDFTLDDDGNLYLSDYTTSPERILRISRTE